MVASFNEQFDSHGAWRREFALRLKLLAEWMRDHDLMDAAVQERMLRLESQMRSDKVMVAFVAEFSRGKSELINAIFFASYGKRIMPASAGRTTMCPTELGWDADVSPCLRLLPIETRLENIALMEWRAAPEKWTRFELDVNNADQLAKTFEKVAEIRKVSKNDAKALGFWHDETPEDNPMVDSEGLVEVPKWRHALINIAHPLLKQGLVILDTPGLNACQSTTGSKLRRAGPSVCSVSTSSPAGTFGSPSRRRLGIARELSPKSQLEPAACAIESADVMSAPP